MSVRLPKIIRSLFKNGKSTAKNESDDDEECEKEDEKHFLLSVLEKFIYAVKQWEPFPLRGHDVEDVNEVNKRVLLAIISFLLCTSFGFIWISVFIIDARRNHEHSPTDSFSSHILSFSVIIVVLSLISFLFTLSGFVGVFRENIVLIRVFYIALIVLLTLKLSVALFTFSFAGAAEHVVGSVIGDSLILNYRISTDIEAMMDYLQIKFRCCGLREQGFQDWNRSIYFNCSDDNPSAERCAVPWSCCHNDTGIHNALCGRNVQTVDRNLASRTIYTKGCIIAILEWAKKHAFLVGFLLLLETLLLTAMIFQCIHLVNELQMINGVYRGPWWTWIGEAMPIKQQRFPQGTERWGERPLAELPFHLELMWHEVATPDAEHSPAVRQQGAPPTDPSGSAWQQQPGPAAGGQASPPTPADQRSPAAGQQTAPPADPSASARHQQRRSTVGQRFFRAVMSRASRMTSRRQAVLTEESVAQGRQQEQQQQRQPGPHEGWAAQVGKSGEQGSPTPADVAKGSLAPVNEELRVELPGVDVSLKAPLPPIGESVDIQTVSREVQDKTDFENVKQLRQGHDQNLREERNITALKEELLEVEQPSDRTLHSDVTSTPAPNRMKEPNEIEKRELLAPKRMPSENQVNLPDIHSGSSKRRLEVVSKVSEKKSKEILPSSPNLSADVRSSGRSSSKDQISKTSSESKLIARETASKLPVISKTELKSNAVEHGVTPPSQAELSLEPPEAPVPRAAPAPAAPVATDQQAAPTQPTLAEAATPSFPPSIAGRPSAPVTTADLSPHRSVSTSEADVDANDRAEADERPTIDDGVTHRTSDVYAGSSQAVTDDGAIPLGSTRDKKTPEGPEDSAISESSSDVQRRKEVSDASTETPSGSRKKDQSRKSKLHKKKKKKGRVSPTEEKASAVDVATENKQTYEWLKPNIPQTSDVPATDESKRSAYFSPSEFQHLATQQSPGATDDDTRDPKGKRRGTIARAISMKLHEIIHDMTPVPIKAQPHQTTRGEDERPPELGAFPRSPGGIFPNLGLHHPGPDDSNPPTSGTPTQPLSLLTEAPQEAHLRPTTSRGQGVSGGTSHASSPLQPGSEEEGSDER